jgi:hypothetical protein
MGRIADRSGGLREIGPVGRIERHILHIRGRRVLLDEDLAEVYGVPTGALNQAVRRNAGRFPADFAFRLTSREMGTMRSQIVTASKRNIRYPSCAFTECVRRDHGGHRLEQPACRANERLCSAGLRAHAP